MGGSTPDFKGTIAGKAGDMLILSRKINERIMIGDQIEIAVVDIKGEHVKIGIKAPNHVKVFRQEVYRAIQQENIEAVKAKPSLLPQLNGILDKAKEKNT